MLHPYVVALCQPDMPYAGPGGHGYFEIALDTTLHAEDTGVSVVPAEDTSPLLPGPDLAEVTALLHTALQETYGLDIPVEHLADAFYHLNRGAPAVPQPPRRQAGAVLAGGAAVWRAGVHHAARQPAAAGQRPARDLDRPLYR